jgi:hypothetical protein
MRGHRCRRARRDGHGDTGRTPVIAAPVKQKPRLVPCNCVAVGFVAARVACASRRARAAAARWCVAVEFQRNAAAGRRPPTVLAPRRPYVRPSTSRLVGTQRKPGSTSDLRPRAPLPLVFGRQGGRTSGGGARTHTHTTRGEGAERPQGGKARRQSSSTAAAASGQPQGERHEAGWLLTRGRPGGPAQPEPEPKPREAATCDRRRVSYYHEGSTTSTNTTVPAESDWT